jgi:hypothetical protein
MISLPKTWNVKNSLSNDSWNAKINMNTNISMEHIRQFFILWSRLQEVNFVEDVMDTISWTLTENGKCMDKSAYKAQFFGATSPLSCLQFGRFGCP